MSTSRVTVLCFFNFVAAACLMPQDAQGAPARQGSLEQYYRGDICDYVQHHLSGKAPLTTQVKYIVGDAILFGRWHFSILVPKNSRECMSEEVIKKFDLTPDHGLKLLRTAAKSGHAGAHYSLGISRIYGFYNLNINKVISHFEFALQRNLKNSRNYLIDIYINLAISTKNESQKSIYISKIGKLLIKTKNLGKLSWNFYFGIFSLLEKGHLKRIPNFWNTIRKHAQDGDLNSLKILVQHNLALGAYGKALHYEVLRDEILGFQPPSIYRQKLPMAKIQKITKNARIIYKMEIEQKVKNSMDTGWCLNNIDIVRIYTCLYYSSEDAPFCEYLKLENGKFRQFTSTKAYHLCRLGRAALQGYRKYRE